MDYRHDKFYYELVEIGHKLMLTSAIVILVMIAGLS